MKQQQQFQSRTIASIKKIEGADVSCRKHVVRSTVQILRGSDTASKKRSKKEKVTDLRFFPVFLVVSTVDGLEHVPHIVITYVRTYVRFFCVSCR